MVAGWSQLTPERRLAILPQGFWLHGLQNLLEEAAYTFGSTSCRTFQDLEKSNVTDTFNLPSSHTLTRLLVLLVFVSSPYPMGPIGQMSRSCSSAPLLSLLWRLTAPRPAAPLACQIPPPWGSSSSSRRWCRLRRTRPKTYRNHWDHSAPRHSLIKAHKKFGYSSRLAIRNEKS